MEYHVFFVFLFEIFNFICVALFLIYNRKVINRFLVSIKYYKSFFADKKKRKALNLILLKMKSNEIN